MKIMMMGRAVQLIVGAFSGNQHRAQRTFIEHASDGPVDSRDPDMGPLLTRQFMGLSSRQRTVRQIKYLADYLLLRRIAYPRFFRHQYPLYFYLHAQCIW